MRRSSRCLPTTPTPNGLSPTPSKRAAHDPRAATTTPGDGLHDINPTLTAIVKGTANQWAIRGGNAQSGGLSTFYSGVRSNVSGYNPMHKEGAIVLGIGGDNSKGSAGTFYEGVLTSGYPSDATENSVQANITAAGYAQSDPAGIIQA